MMAQKYEKKSSGVKKSFFNLKFTFKSQVIDSQMNFFLSFSFTTAQ